MAASYREILRSLSRNLQQQSQSHASSFGHPTAKGDAREAQVRTFLAQRVGTAFGVAKAEIVDRDGKTTPEHDAVVFDQRAAACLDVAEERRIVRVESVAMVVEVKSRLEVPQLRAESQRVEDGVGRLKRFFAPAPLLRVIRSGVPKEVRESIDAMFAQGLGGRESNGDEGEDAPAIASAYFAFDGPNDGSLPKPSEIPHIDLICVLGKYTVARQRQGFRQRPGDACDDPVHWYQIGTGDDALGAFLYKVEGLLTTHLTSRWLLEPSNTYYFGEALKRQADSSGSS